MARKPPRQKPGQSETVVVTPPEFMAAVHATLGIAGFDIDLAAGEDNSQGLFYYDKETNGLEQEWTNFNYRVSNPWFWCNPPYDDIRPWVEKASREVGWRRILDRQPSLAMLVPASVGSNWWRDYVHKKCKVLFLNGRIQFVGHTTGYPKDLALLLYGIDVVGYDIWRWKDEL